MRKNEAMWIESRERWQINVQNDGERKTFTSSKVGKKGKIEAERKADEWLELKLDKSGMKIETLLELYEKKIEKSGSKANLHHCKSYTKNWVKPNIGHKKICKLTKNDLQGIIDVAYSEGNLSNKSLRNIRAFLMSFLNFCIDENATNLIVRKLNIPKSAKRSNKRILKANELKILFSSNCTVKRGREQEDFYIHVYRYAIATGLRPGELIGLMWSNINDDKVTITQSINDANEITQGKNENAQRAYIMTSQAKKIITEQKEMMINLGIRSKYVFCNQDGEHITQENLRNDWKRYCKANGIEPISLYEMRHTFVSINSEMPDTLKKMIVGHSKNMDTDAHYSHQKQGDLERAAKYVEDALSQYIK